MNQEEINLLNNSFNVSSEDLSALLDFIQTIIREYVILPWCGEGHPYTFNRTIRVEFKIDGIGTTEAIFGICPPLKDEIILGAPYAFQNKVTYSTHGNIEYLSLIHISEPTRPY